MQNSFKPPVIGRALAVAVILGFFLWSGLRVISGKPSIPNTSLPAPALDAPLAAQASESVAVFAGGCFWGTQAVFEHVLGVKRVNAGYSGGTVANPYYELVSTGSTGHAESVRIVFDPARVRYGQLLMIFFGVAHDPTQRDRQGPDIGTQYRSAIFYTTDEQRKIAEAYIAQLEAAKVYKHPIATRVGPYASFYSAEAYHQDYLQRHPDDAYIQFNDLPKLERLKREFPQFYRCSTTD
jgi:peptide-methionine (S)-S-oxide reductase